MLQMSAPSMLPGDYQEYLQLNQWKTVPVIGIQDRDVFNEVMAKTPPILKNNKHTDNSGLFHRAPQRICAF